MHVPIFDQWKSWFYSHANATFVYDISGGTYNQFEAFIYFPNPCQAGRTVQMICFADDVQVYQSEILRPPDAQNKHLTVTIPEGTKKWTIQITDAGDGMHCDHFALGQAQISYVEMDIPEPPEDTVENVICEDCTPETEINVVPEIPEELAVTPQNKLTLKWATLKSVR